MKEMRSNCSKVKNSRNFKIMLVDATSWGGRKPTFIDSERDFVRFKNEILTFSTLCVLWHSSHADGTRIQSWPSPRLLSSSDEELELSSEADESRPELLLGRNTFILGPFCAAPLLLRKGEKLLSTWASKILDSDLEAVWGNNAWSGLADSTTAALSSKVAALFHVNELVERRGMATLFVGAS